MQDLKISLVQTELHWENRQANLRMFDEKIASIKEGPDVIVLPEMFTTGFSMMPENLADTMAGESIEWMKKQAAKANATITGSVIITEDSNYYNRLIWMQPDGNSQTYDKRHLFSMAGEEKHYTAGDKKLFIEHKGWKICPMVCYDLRFPVWIRNTENYDVLIFVANWPERRAQHWRKLLQARAIENQCFVIGVNRFGKDGNDIDYSGNSMAVNPLGEIIVEIENEAAIETVSLDYDELVRTRRYMPFLKDMDRFELLP